MGRPPIGKMAMSAAERQRRRRAKFRDTSPVTKQPPPTPLSMSAQQRLDAAIRAEKRRLDAEFQQSVHTEIKRIIDVMVLPEWRERLDEADHVLKTRKGIITYAVYRNILACLHPDRVANEELKQRYTRAFNNFSDLRLVLCDEKELPTTAAASTVPRGYAAWAAAEEAAKRRKPKRSAAPTRKGVSR